LSFDLNDSREFCRRTGLLETTIIDFVDIWDRIFAIDYRHVREAIKAISLMNFGAVENATCLSDSEFARLSVSPDDLAVFIDDDDWLAPDLFTILRNAQELSDGARWGSIRIGAPFTFEPKPEDHVFAYRPIDNILYTNNYAVTGRCISNVGLRLLLEHFDAQHQFNTDRFHPQQIAEYLSCANKHPCSSLAARFFMSSDSFKKEPISSILAFYEALGEIDTAAAPSWVLEPVQKLRALMARVIDHPTPLDH
jgi:hypothetical protein